MDPLSDSMTTIDTTRIAATSLVAAEEKMFSGILADIARLRLENQKLVDSLAEARRIMPFRS